MKIQMAVVSAALLGAASVASAEIENVTRYYDITGVLNLSVTGGAGGAELTKFALLLSSGDPHRSDITRGSDDLHQEWDMSIREAEIESNPLYTGNEVENNPLFDAPSNQILVSPMGGSYGQGPNGQLLASMGGLITLTWATPTASLVGVADHERIWQWTARERFGDESFTATLGSDIPIRWMAPESAATLPNITILAGSHLTYTLVPAPGLATFGLFAGVCAARRRR